MAKNKSTQKPHKKKPDIEKAKTARERKPAKIHKRKSHTSMVPIPPQPRIKPKKPKKKDDNNEQ